MSNDPKIEIDNASSAGQKSEITNAKPQKFPWGTATFFMLMIAVAFQACGPKTYGNAEARAMCELQIEKLLKAPKTADFSSGSDVRVTGASPGPFSVRGYVDAQNSFGATLRKQYACTLTFDGDTAKFSEARIY